MIQSKPKSGTLIGIGLFLFGTLAVAMWLFVQLIQNPGAYFWVKLILAPMLVVIFMTVAVKTFFSAIFLTVGNNQLIYRYLLGSEKKHKISDVVSWQEEVVKSKSNEYRRLIIQLKNGKKLQLSNHENSDYKDVVNYLSKKVKKAQVMARFAHDTLQ